MTLTATSPVAGTTKRRLQPAFLAQQDDSRGPASDRGDLESVHRETVVEARGSEVAEQPLVDV